MNGGRYIRQAIIAALCEHPDQDKYKTRAFAGENLQKAMDAIASDGSGLSKADFFTPDDEGRFIIDTAGFWRNFEKIRDIVHKNGEKFRFEDFTRPLGRDDSRTLLDGARMHGGLGKLFSSEVWTGRFDEMERLWYKLPVTFRRDVFRNDGLLDPALKKRMLAAEGRESPEERLAKAGVSPFELKNAFAERGNYEEIARRLSQAGDWMRKEYLLLPDNSGDTLFYYQGVWDRYDELVKGMKAHGEKMEVADFIRQVGNVLNPLARAAERGALSRVFTPEHWADRLPEMLDLWTHVLPGWKTGSMTPKDFDRAYASAESLTYAKRIDLGAIEAKSVLLLPMNDPAPGAAAVIPLGLKALWDSYPSVQQQLAARGEKITVSDLRIRSGHMGDTCLLSAVKFGHFCDVAGISRRSEPLSLDDYLSRDRHGNTLLSILAERNELAQAFSPDLWIGRISDMKALWSHVHVKDRGQVDIQQMEVAAKQATLKHQSKGNKFRL